MSNLVHYGIASTIAKSAKDVSVSDRAYMDSKIVELINARITPLDTKASDITDRVTTEVKTLTTSISTNVTTLNNSINKKVDITDFDDTVSQPLL